MKFLSAAAVAFAAIAAASPLTKRDYGLTDADILNYALTLEHLEDAFYREGLHNFTLSQFQAAGYDEAFYNNIKEISFDETTHVSFLTSALTAAGASPVAECTYAFGVTSVQSFLATASILEGVGVSAYLGAAASIASKSYLTAAGSILTVEARHSAYLRQGLRLSPFAQPFDDPLSLDEVYSLAAQFIVSCPSTNVPLPLKAFPILVASSTDVTIKAGSTIMLSTPGYVLTTVGGSNTPVYGAFITVTGPIFVLATMVTGGFTVTVPTGVYGQSYVVLTGCNTAVTDDTIAAGPAIVEIFYSAGGN